MNLRIFPGTENIDFGKDRPHIGNTDSTDLSSGGNLYLEHLFFFSTGLGEGILDFNKNLVRGDTGFAGVIEKIGGCGYFTSCVLCGYFICHIYRSRSCYVI